MSTVMILEQLMLVIPFQFFKLTSKCACPHKSGVCGKAGGGGGGSGSSDDGGSDPGVVGIVLMCL